MLHPPTTNSNLLHRLSAVSYSPSCQADTTRYAFETGEETDTEIQNLGVARFKKLFSTAHAFVIFTLLYVPIHLAVSLSARRQGALFTINALQQWRQQGAAFLALNPSVVKEISFEIPTSKICSSPTSYGWPRLLHWNFTPDAEGTGRIVSVRKLSMMDPQKYGETSFAFTYPSGLSVRLRDEFDLRVMTLLLKNPDCRKFHWSLLTNDATASPHWRRLLDLIQLSETQCLSRGAVSPMTRIGETRSPWAFLFSVDSSQMAAGEDVTKYLETTTVKMEVDDLRCAKESCLIRID